MDYIYICVAYCIYHITYHVYYIGRRVNNFLLCISKKVILHKSICSCVTHMRLWCADLGTVTRFSCECEYACKIVNLDSVYMLYFYTYISPYTYFSLYLECHSLIHSPFKAFSQKSAQKPYSPLSLNYPQENLLLADPRYPVRDCGFNFMRNLWSD